MSHDVGTCCAPVQGNPAGAPIEGLCDDVPSMITAGAAGSPGISDEGARCDHVHPVPVAAAGQLNIGDASAAGAAGTLARSDHVHAFPAPIVVAAVDASVGALGISTVVAREDHRHQVITGTPVTVTGDTNADGTSDDLARADHVHRLEVAVEDDGAPIGQRPTLNFTGAGVTVTDNAGTDAVDIAIPGGGGSLSDGFEVRLARDGVAVTATTRRVTAQGRTAVSVTATVSGSATLTAQWRSVVNLQTTTVEARRLDGIAGASTSSASATGTQTTTSDTFATVPSMSIALGVGTWHVTFSADIEAPP